MSLYTTDNIVDEYEAATRYLSDLYVARSEALAAELTTRASTYAALAARGDLNITAIREQADHAAYQHKAQAIKLSGDIDAKLAWMRWADVWLHFNSAT